MLTTVSVVLYHLTLPIKARWLFLFSVAMLSYSPDVPGSCRGTGKLLAQTSELCAAEPYDCQFVFAVV